LSSGCVSGQLKFLTPAEAMDVHEPGIYVEKGWFGHFKARASSDVRGHIDLAAAYNAETKDANGHLIADLQSDATTVTTSQAAKIAAMEASYNRFLGTVDKDIDAHVAIGTAAIQAGQAIGTQLLPLLTASRNTGVPAGPGLLAGLQSVGVNPMQLIAELFGGMSGQDQSALGQILAQKAGALISRGITPPPRAEDLGNRNPN